MAKKKVEDPAQSRAALLTGLRRAADGQVRLLHGIAKQNPLFTSKDGEALAQQALDSGYLEVVEAASPATKKGKGAAPRHVRLTDRGRQLLVEEDSPKKLLESLLPLIQNLSEQLTAGTRALEATTRLVQAVLAQLDTASKQPAPAVPPPVVAPKTISSPESPASSPRDVLHRAYDKLCLLVDFRDGLVELPRLYHEARKTLPTLNVEDFHRELRSLWQAREIELHILNEVRSAAEPDLGIWRDNHLYYYIFWRRS
jgi:hypothetical protein